MLSAAVTWRVHSGVTYLATSLTQLALELEELPGHDGSKQRTYRMIQEASKLLPLFQSHTEAVFAEAAEEIAEEIAEEPDDAGASPAQASTLLAA